MAHHAHDHGHHAPGQHAHHAPGSDKGAAFIGLIGGAVLIAAVLYGITMWTNSLFEGKSHGAAPGAAATKTGH